jgi:sialate O-acetylesterase
MKQTRLIIGLSVVLALGLPARHGFAQDPGGPGMAKPFVSAMFGDEMVLQRGRPVPVWGWTTPGQTVVVTAQGKLATATAGRDGYWKATLDTLTVGAPFDLTVAGAAGQTQTFHDVLAGDVWVCSGQSNMEFGIGNLSNATDEIAAANYPQIRLFKVGHDVALEPHTQPQASWTVCTPDTIKQGGWNGFSAVGYFFGRDLYQQLHVPIGLVESDWGGTPAEAWTSASALAKMPEFRSALAALDQKRTGATGQAASYAQQVDVWYRKNDPGSVVSTWADPSLDTSAWKTMALPTAWEAAGVPELSAFDGVLWYRKTVDLPAEAAGKAADLHLGPIDDNDTTYVNGVEVGRTEGYLTPRNYTIPAGTLKAGANVIAVRVLDTGGAGGIDGKADDMHLDVSGGTPLSLAGDWIYRVGIPLAQAGPPPVQFTVDQNSPTVLFNGMINPLIPDAIKGAIWYQGESNAGRAYQYRTLLPTMINDWRSRWGEGAFPFYIVQLANFQAQQPQPGDSDWAELREAQSMTARNLPNSGIAVIIDIGNPTDIHPKDKQDVGKRLSLIALAQTYGQKIEYSGPEYKSMKRYGSGIRLAFDHIGGGLVAKGGPLTGFAIAGADRKFVWADAVIQGDTILVSSPQVPNPVAVRYAWADNPACNLYNKADLPASPFRTDDWPGVTGGKK